MEQAVQYGSTGCFHPPEQQRPTGHWLERNGVRECGLVLAWGLGYCAAFLAAITLIGFVLIHTGGALGGNAGVPPPGQQDAGQQQGAAQIGQAIYDLDHWLVGFIGLSSVWWVVAVGLAGRFVVGAVDDSVRG